MSDDPPTGDFTLVAGSEGKVFHFHERVAELSSPYFTAALGSGLREGRERIISKANWSPEVCHCLQRFMYMGEIEIPLDLVKDVYDAADEAQIEVLLELLKGYNYCGLITSAHDARAVLEIGERMESESLVSFANQVLEMGETSFFTIEASKSTMRSPTANILFTSTPKDRDVSRQVPTVSIKPSGERAFWAPRSLTGHFLVISKCGQEASTIINLMERTPAGNKKKASHLAFSIRFVVPMTVAMAARDGHLTKPVNFWVHKGSSMGFYLDGGHMLNTVTANGTLQELLQAVSAIQRVLTAMGEPADGNGSRCSLRISAPSQDIMKKLYDTQQTIGIDMAASSCYLIRPLSEMYDILAMLTGQANTIPIVGPHELRHVVNLCYPPREQRI